MSVQDKPEDNSAPAEMSRLEAMEAAGGFKGFIASRLNLPNDDKDKILFVAVALCLVCSVLVSAAAVALRPLQERNAELDRRSNILAVAGLMKPGIDVEKAFEAFEPRLVNLDTGEFTDEISLDEFKQRAAMGDPTLSHELGSDEDSAGIGSRNNYAEVYLLREGDAIDQIIIPVYGKGLWSTLYGYMSLKSDLNTIAGLQFYEHAETPGLGGEVDNPNWRALWHDKVAYDDNGDVALEVIKGTVDRNSAAAEHQVDGLAGASLTTRGVNNLVRFWLGQNGFGPFLRNLNAGGDA